jgi:hypothetical protein
LYSHGLVEKGFLSFPSSETAEHQIRFPSNDDIISFDFDVDVEQFSESLPYAVDDVELRVNHADTHIVEPYIQSYFNITTETRVDQDSLFLSEKIYKPIANYQPFLIVGSQYSLRKLKEDGYRTFNGAIDESYDDVANYADRHAMVMKEVYRLCNMSLEELHDWYWELEEILVHNRSVLKSKVRHSDMFRNEVWEIINNKEIE